jgi:hypothetical protein
VRDHRLIDERSLALAQAIADRLRLDPDLIELARANLERWGKTCSPRGISALDEWRTVLDGPIDGMLALLTGEDERAVRLRQSNPFAGALPQKVRNEILLRFEARDKAASLQLAEKKT